MNTFKITSWTVILVIVLFVIAPFLWFGAGYLSGLVTEWVIGDTLINGINLILKSDLKKDTIPLISGTLSWIGMFFKEVKYNQS